MQEPNETSSVQDGGKIPVGIDEWEQTLVRYFLVIGPEGDASDIHSLEISRRTLALACGVDSSREKEVEAAFHKALIKDPHLLPALKSGSRRRPTDNVPNCFAPLAMTLFIDILLDNQTDSGNEFRAKLADWLQIDRTFSDLRGVASMWEELVEWLKSRVAAGAPFRRLVLPVPPKSWKHIGYTRRLSFPNRADVRLVSHVLETLPARDADNPTAVLDAFAPLVNRGAVSMGLKDAFDDFRHSYYAQRRAIAEHRFWLLVTQARPGAQRVAHRTATLEITFTEDDEREFRAFDDTGHGQSYARLGEALADSAIASSANLGPAVKRGTLFFRQGGIGRWRAEPDLACCRDRVHVVFRARHRRALGQRLGALEHDGDWYITVSPLPVSTVGTALRVACLVIGPADRLFRPGIFEGVRVRGAWLGLPGFLPCVESDTDKIEVFCDTAGAAPVRAQVDHGVLRLVSDVPLAGVYRVEPRLRESERSAPWRLRMQFVDRAAPHGRLEGARRKLSPLSEWLAAAPASITSELPAELGWERAEEPMERLLEALYASGAGGWDEADLVNLIRRAGPEPASDAWRTLRALQEGGALEPRLRQRWRGRAWTLVAPCIVAATGGGAEVALAEGALCAHLLEDFQLAVEGLGGRAFRLRGASPWAVPVVGAVGASAIALAQRLGWEFAAQVPSLGTAPLALARTERHGEHYRVAFTWCWQLRRFVDFGAVEGRVRLTQRAHISSTDHDVYRVEAGDRMSHYLSRHAAIVAAHAAAGVPLFEFLEDRIELRAREGALPDALAVALRRRRLQAAGLGGGRYAYPATAEDARWLLSLLPGCVEGVPADEGVSQGGVLSAARRSGGARRAQWRDGRLVL